MHATCTEELPMAKATRQPAEDRYPLKLTAKERQRLMDDLEGLEAGTVAVLKGTPKTASFQLTFDQLEDLAYHLTDLVRMSPLSERELPAGMFKKISEAMRIAAAEELDED